MFCARVDVSVRVRAHACATLPLEVRVIGHLNAMECTRRMDADAVWAPCVVRMARASATVSVRAAWIVLLLGAEPFGPQLFRTAGAVLFAETRAPSGGASSHVCI